MVICFSLTNLERGGAQTFVLRLASALKKKGHHVLIYDHQPDFRNEEQLQLLEKGIKIYSFSENRVARYIIWKINAFGKLLGIEFQANVNKKRFRNLIRQKQVQVVNSHMAASDFITAEILVNNCAFIPTLHGEYELLRDSPQHERLFLERIITVSHRADLMIYTADKNLTGLAGVEKKPELRKISVGLDPAQFTRKQYGRSQFGIPEEAFVIGMVSRGIPEKGWDSAIEAVQECRKGAPEMVLVMIGDGEYLEQLHAKINDPYIKHISFEENYQDYFSCYALFDVFILPTRFKGESVPNAVIEAMSQGLPIVATRHAEIPLMIDADSPTPAGVCVEASPALKNELVAHLTELRNNTGYRKQLSVNCARAFQKFNLEAIAEQYVDVFRDTIKTKAQRG